jgi:class 3 adenylate cyclase
VGYLKHKDDSAFPIIYARFEGEATTSGFDEYTAWLDAVTARAAARGERLVSIIHAPGRVQISGEVRRHIGDWTSKQVPTDTVVGSIVVFDSAVLRGVMTAVSWVSPKQMQRVDNAATVAEAWQLATTLLLQAGIQPPTSAPWLKG